MSFWQEFNARLRALSLAIAVHVLMAALVVLGTMNWEPFRKPQNIGMTIEAVIVDTSEIKKQRVAARQAAEMEDRRRQRDERLEEQKKREQEQKKIRVQEAAEKRKRELEAQKKRDSQDRLQKLRMERERKLEDERLKQQRELLEKYMQLLLEKMQFTDLIVMKMQLSKVLFIFQEEICSKTYRYRIIKNVLKKLRTFFLSFRGRSLSLSKRLG